jgi:hypothetical protein
MPRRKRCHGGLPECKNLVPLDYKDVDGVGCCEQCDKHIDENPYDPYWEQMQDAFGNTKEYEEIEKSGYDAYEKAFEKFQETYEQWPVMRRRMAKRNSNKR